MPKILAIGAHFDDVELRCLGTLLKAKDNGYSISLLVVSDGSKGGSAKDRLVEQQKVNHAIGYNNTWYLGKKDGEVLHNSETVSDIENIIKDLRPDIIFTHTQDDFHQDHIAVAKSVIAANRLYNSSVLTFSGQDFRIHNNPNVYVDITEYLDRKKEILDMYKSQKHKKYWKENQHETESFYLRYIYL